MRVSTALGRRSMVRMGPVIRATEDPPRTPPTSRHLTSPLTVQRELRRCRLAWRLPPTRSHGGSQGFKSPHLHPKPRRSERRQRRAGDARPMLGPRTPMEGCSTSAEARLPKLVNRQSNPSTINNSVCFREQAGHPSSRTCLVAAAHWLLSCWTCRPAGTATGPVGPATLARYCPLRQRP